MGLGVESDVVWNVCWFFFGVLEVVFCSVLWNCVVWRVFVFLNLCCVCGVFFGGCGFGGVNVWSFRVFGWSEFYCWVGEDGMGVLSGMGCIFRFLEILMYFLRM